MHRVKLCMPESDGPVKAIHFGSMVAREPALWRPAQGRLELPGYLTRWLGLSPGETVHAWADPTGEHIHVGPVLGLLLDEASATLPEGPGAAQCRSLYRAAREAGMLPVFFARSDAAPGADTVNGWADRDGRWVRVQFPLPDVLYGGAACGTAIGPHNVVPVNSTHSLSRSGVTQALSFFPATRGLVGDRSRGREGGALLRVSGDRGFWQVSGMVGGRFLSEGFSTPDSLFRFLRQLSGSVPVPDGEVDGPLCRLLAVAQKDGTGSWQIPLVSLRRLVAGPVAVRVSTASEPLDPDLVGEHFGHSAPSDLRRMAAAAALKAAAALEARYGRLGDIGVELSVERGGQSRVLKCTADPSRLVARPASGSPFAYALHLAERAWAGRYSGALCL